MATLNQMRTRVDAWLADKWPTVIARQQNYYANRGVYWQGLITHTVVPSHTNSTDGDSIADRLSITPTDAFQDWITAFPEWDGVSLPCAVKVDTYGKPDGWCLTIYVRYNGTLYSRAQNVGPESHRTYAWRVEQEGGE